MEILLFRNFPLYNLIFLNNVRYALCLDLSCLVLANIQNHVSSTLNRVNTNEIEDTEFYSAND